MYRIPGPRAERAGSRPGEQGFIVLGLLIAVTVAMVTGALIGQIIHQNRYRTDIPLEAREVRYAVRAVEIRYGALPTGRIAPRDSVWVRAVGEGQVAVFRGRDSQKIVGFVPDSLLIRSRPIALGGE